MASSANTVDAGLQQLLQETILVTGHVADCAVIRRKDGAVRAGTSGFKVSDAEVEGIRESFRDPAYAREHVLRVGEQQFNCVRADESAIYAKNGKAGVVIGQTTQYFVLATYSPNMFASICAEAAESLAEFLRDKGK
eukprot:m.237342 g.237342  ORF g.237342 m.237342 type:complete len:137 (-) comp21069_c0_seq1:63-473(-)